AHEGTCAAAGIGEVQVSLGAGDDSLNATSLTKRVRVFGDEGSDTIFTGSGNDVILDGNIPTDPNGHDAYVGGAGNDTFDVGGDGSDVLTGNDGDDTLDGGAGADVMWGNAGSDTADYSASQSSVTVTLDDNVGDGALLEGDNVRSDVENVIGSSFDDVLNGND